MANNTPLYVPPEEQPWTVPGNWVWTRLGFPIAWGSGGTPSRKHPEYYNGSIPWVKTGELEDDYIQETEEHISEAGMQNSSAKTFPVQTVILAMYGATVGKTAILGIPATTNQACACGVCSTAVNYKYLFYYLRSQKDIFIGKSRGGAQPNISQQIIKQHEFPLPPLPEQQRIVDRIDSLFGKLDEARAKAQAVLDGYELRRAAILHRAFAGELTKKWRTEHGRDNNSWRTVTFNEVADIKSNLVNPLDYSNYPHIAPDNIEKRTGVLLDFHTISEDKITSSNHLFHAGQILYSKIRPYLSKVVIASFDGLCSADMYPIEARTGIDTEFLWYYMLSDDFLYQASTAGSRSLLPKINRKEMSRIHIRITDLDEQKVLTRMLKAAISREQDAKTAVEEVLERIDLMKKKILGMAFRGELGTNDPAETSAAELLEQIRKS